MNKLMKKARYAVAVPLTLAAGAVLAEVPATVTTAIDGAKTDGLSVGWVVVGVLAALFVIQIVKRMIR